nr:uncharacterized protein LOC117856458 [Setaria viridis]
MQTRDRSRPNPSNYPISAKPGCFGCYMAYWSCWDGSLEGDREAIHHAIEAFEEHLAKEEIEGTGGDKWGGGARRGRKKRAAKEKATKGKGKGKSKEVVVDPLHLPPPPMATAASPTPEEVPKAEDGAEYLTAEEEKEHELENAAAGEEDKRGRGWGGVLADLAVEAVRRGSAG